MNGTDTAGIAASQEFGGSILCGVDDTEEARQVARVAAGLAERLRCPLMLAHVVSEPWVSTRPYATLGERTQEAEAFERSGHETTVLEPIAATLDSPSVSVVEFGQPPDKLRELAEAHDAGLIAVGTGSLGALEEFVVGSTTMALTRASPCPVVVVPPKAAPRTGNAIVCGVDDSEAAVAVAASADALARALALRLVIVHVGKPSDPDTGSSETALARVRSRAPGAKLELVSADSTEKALATVATEQDAEMIVVGAHDHGLAHSTLFGSVFRALLKIADRPVVVVPPESRSRASANREPPA